MAKSTSVVLDEEHEVFIAERIARGTNKSASEVMREALDHFREEEAKEAAWQAEMELAMNSPIAPPGAIERLFAKHGIRERDDEDE